VCLRLDQVSRLIGRQWTRCVELGLDVVLDLGFWSRRERDQARAATVALGAGARLPV
jgi:predicted kinase